MEQFVVTELGKRLHTILSDVECNFFPETYKDLQINPYLEEWNILADLGCFILISKSGKVTDNDICSLDGDYPEYEYWLATLLGKEGAIYMPNTKYMDKKDMYISELFRIGAINNS